MDTQAERAAVHRGAYDVAELAPFTAAEELCVAPSDATKASPLRLPAHEPAALRYRKFCPIHDATT